MTRRKSRNEAACPFCGTWHTKILRSSTPPEDGGYFRLECLNCGSMGPIGRTVTEAARFFDAREEPEERDDG